jgi:hypothetical protein
MGETLETQKGRKMKRDGALTEIGALSENADATTESSQSAGAFFTGEEQGTICGIQEAEIEPWQAAIRDGEPPREHHPRVWFPDEDSEA